MSEIERMITEEVDPNMIVESSLGETDIRFYDVREAPFEIYGLYDPKGQPVFKRLPDEVAKSSCRGVRKLYLDTAGGRVRFSTDSKYVAIKAVMPFTEKKPHMSLLGASGLDLYVDYAEAGVKSRYRGSFKPPVDMDKGYESIIRFKDRQTRYFTVNMPNYNHLDALYVGLQEDAFVGEGKKYPNEKPVVFYGSSITQGGCATRPGMAYQSIISRNLDLDFVNLGFSGNCKGDIALCEYMATLPMSIFVCDYDHNAPDPEFLLATHKRVYDIIREKNPRLPYIMLSRPDFDVNTDESIKRRNIIADTYRYAREKGDKNVYYIDGEGIFRGPDEDSCTVDGTHPNDLGFMKMADSIGMMIERVLRKNG